MKILISGGNGQLAYDCRKIFSEKNEVVSPGSKEMNVTAYEQIEVIANKFKPDIIINCAAYTKVDACESEKESARKVNVDGPNNLSKIAEKFGCKLVHFSTDYVFNGEKKITEYYVENENTAPSSYYGKSKLEGELVIKNSAARHIIIRTSWLYGIHGYNFLKTILRVSLKNPQKPIKVVNDQFGSLTWTCRLALQTEKIIAEDGRGTYHATSEGYGSWYEIAKYFLQQMDIPQKIVPCSTKEYITPAHRPANSILENQRLKKEGINIMPRWKNDLDKFVLKFRTSLINEATGGK